MESIFSMSSPGLLAAESAADPGGKVQTLQAPSSTIRDWTFRILRRSLGSVESDKKGGSQPTIETVDSDEEEGLEESGLETDWSVVFTTFTRVQFHAMSFSVPFARYPDVYRIVKRLLNEAPTKRVNRCSAHWEYKVGRQVVDRVVFCMFL